MRNFLLLPTFEKRAVVKMKMVNATAAVSATSCICDLHQKTWSLPFALDNDLSGVSTRLRQNQVVEDGSLPNVKLGEAEVLARQNEVEILVKTGGPGSDSYFP